MTIREALELARKENLIHSDGFDTLMTNALERGKAEQDAPQSMVDFVQNHPMNGKLSNDRPK